MKRLAIILFVLGALGLVGVAAGVMLDRTTALAAYLVAFTYWITLSLGCLVFVLMAHAGRMRWLVSVRRVAELWTTGMPAFVLLAVPLFVFARDLYPWAGANTNTSPIAAEVLHHRHHYLNMIFGVARTLICFLVFVGASEVVNALQRRLDSQPTLDDLNQVRSLSALALPLFALTLTCASFDWLMVLDATYFSTAFGVYVFAGSFVSGLALLGLLMHRARKPDIYSPSHFHALGRLMLSFTVFWVYMAYCQFFLAWIADLPEEVPYYLARMTARWTPFAWLLVIAHFVVPFFLLLPRAPKLRSRYVALVGVLILFAHYLDVYWLVMPSVTPTRAIPTFWHLAAMVGVGGVSMGLAAWRSQSRSLVPTHDPDLAFALRYQSR